MRSKACLVLLMKNCYPVVSFLNPSEIGNIQVKAVTATVLTPSNVIQLKVMVPYPTAYMKKAGKRKYYNSRF